MIDSPMSIKNTPLKVKSERYDVYRKICQKEVNDRE